MSRRRIEAGFNAASSSFSIKEQNTSNYMRDDSSVSVPLVPKTTEHAVSQISFQIPNNTNIPQTRSIPLPVAHVSGVPSGLTFKLNCLPSKQPSSTPELSLPQKAGSEHAFGMPLNCMKSNNHLINPEVMRLSAQKDDLRTRLKASSEKTMVLETQLQRMQKTVMKDRGDFAKQLTSSRAEIKSIRETESKLRAHIVELKTSFEKKVCFEAAVKTAMQSKEIAVAQSKLNEVRQQTAVMEQQLEELQKIRDAVVEETRSHELSKEEHETLTKQSAEIRSKIKNDEARLFDTTEQIVKVDGDIEHRKSQFDNITSSIKDGEEKLKACRTELEASKQEHASIVEKIGALESDLNSKSALQSKKLFVSGDDHHPTNMLLCTAVDSVCKRVDDMSDSSSGIPYHFDLDAPISLTGYSTQMINAATDAEDMNANTEAMLAAIVGDLKQFLAQAKVENENRGIDKGGQAVGSPLGH